MNSLILQKQNPWWETGKIERKIFPRAIIKELIKNLENEKILALIGSRQVGKTSILYLLIQQLLKKTKKTNILYFNLDDLTIRELFSTPETFLQYLNLKKQRKYLCIDEVQRLDNPGLFLKTIHDLKLNIKIIVSGSSQLELRSKLKEFLVGRIRQFEIPRLTYNEIHILKPNIPKTSLLENILIYGTYPEVAKESNNEEKKLLLRDIHQTYIQKDISDFAKINNIDGFNKLLILIAAQIGGLLNIHALSKSLKISTTTIEHYLNILEGTFIIKRMYPFFQNYKKEITKTPKVYFLDLGLRNYLLSNWHSIELRNDKGQLFENFLFIELYAQDIYKIKKYRYWRTTNQTEIDFIIEEGNALMALETKYQSQKTPKSFATFKKYYPNSTRKVVTPKSFLKTH